MNLKHLVTLSLVAITGAILGTPCYGQLLFSENFDDGNASTRWVANNPGENTFNAPAPMDTNFDLDADGVTDDTSGFAFDYSTVGVPAAPNSGGSTVGLKLQANLFSDVFGGFSVSPMEQSFTGDYVLSYDMWQNFNGPLDGAPPNTFNGTTNIAYGGVMTSGTTPNMAGIADGVWFASTPDGDSGADYRVYSYERQYSHQVPAADDIDSHATYFADSRNNSADYYRLNINPDTGGGLGDITAPQEQIDLFSQQTGNLRAGAMGFAWRHHEVSKIGNLVTWTVDGLDLISLDLTDVDPETLPGGENILFGYGDINASSSTDFNAQFLLFALVDNVEVNVAAAQEDADFNGDGMVDGTDFLTWQRGFGTPDAQLADGDANDDGAVDADDLMIWQNQYGTPLQASVAAVPEPASLVTLLFSGIMALLGYRPCRQYICS